MKTSSLPLVVLLSLAASMSVRAEEEKAVPTLVSVRTAKIITATLRSEVVGFGTVDGAPVSGSGGQAGGALLAASSPGIVMKVLAAEGSRVAKGDLLVQMDSRSADAALFRARAQLESARKAHARQLSMKSSGGASERSLLDAAAALASAEGELAAAELAQAQLAVRAPLAGVVARLSVRPGEWLETGKFVAEVIDPSNLVVNAQVPSGEASDIRSGAMAAIVTKLGQEEHEVAAGKVNFISPLTSKESDSVAVRIALAEGAALRAGQLVVARIITTERKDCLAVPVESVVEVDGQTVVAIVKDGVAKQVPVKTGLRCQGLVEVAGEGVAPGVEVVTVGAYGLPKETKVNVTSR